MKAHHFSLLRFIKEWTLPVAIVVGSTLYILFAYLPLLEPVTNVLGPICEDILPMSVFIILFVTFTKVDIRKMRLARWHLWVLLAQMFLVALFTSASFVLDFSANWKYVLEAILICSIAPCATAAPVVTGKLGGNVTDMTTFTLLSSLVAAIVISAIFPLLEMREELTFFSAFWVILKKLLNILVLPLILGMLTRLHGGSVYKWIESKPNLGFYGWCFSLAITSGVTMRNIINGSDNILLLFTIALASLAVALLQQRIGRIIGNKVGEQVCTLQAMFQKNTALAIWVSYIYLTPLASIGAGCYVLWQNIINSIEIHKYEHKKS